MKIGFDLDGTICDIDIYQLNHIRDNNLEGTEDEFWYYKSRQVILNPYTYMAQVDDGYIITGRPPRLQELTEEWLTKNGIRLSVYCIGNRPKNSEFLFSQTVQNKADTLQDLGVKVYITDSWIEVNLLRTILGDDVAIIHYGFGTY